MLTTSPVEPDARQDLQLQSQAEDLPPELARLRQHVLEQANNLADQIALTDRACRASALNLAHYLGMRQHDLRPM